MRWAINCFFLFLHSFQHFARCWSSPLSRSLKVSFFICEFSIYWCLSEFASCTESLEVPLMKSWQLTQGNIFASNLESFDSWLFTCIGFGVFFSLEHFRWFWTYSCLQACFPFSAFFLDYFLKWAEMLLLLITL